MEGGLELWEIAGKVGERKTLRLGMAGLLHDITGMSKTASILAYLIRLGQAYLGKRSLSSDQSLDGGSVGANPS